jgi:hypothetical protein
MASIHNEDLWPDLVPPAAVRRTNPAKVIYGPTATPDVLVPYRPLCYRCPTHVVPLPAPSLARRGSMDEDSSATTALSLGVVSTEHAGAIATGAQQWQQYWAHDRAVSPVPTPTIATSDQSSPSSTTGEPMAISTGAQQWQAYWDHDTVNTGILTDKAKFNLFVKIFAVPHHLTNAMIALSDSLAEAYPLRITQEQDTQGPGTATIIGMCDTIGRIGPQDKIQEEFTEDFGTAIITTCKSLTGLFPQSKIQNRASILCTDVQAKDVNIFTDVSPSASAHSRNWCPRNVHIPTPPRSLRLVK